MSDLTAVVFYLFFNFFYKSYNRPTGVVWSVLQFHTHPPITQSSSAFPRPQETINLFSNGLSQLPSRGFLDQMRILVAQYRK